MTPSSHPRRLQRLLLALLPVLLLLPAGCGEDAPGTGTGREPAKPPWLWSSLGFWNDFILGVSLHDGALYLSAGKDGVHRQSPAFFGDWERLGLEFPGMPGDFPLYGVNDVVAADGDLFALVRHPEGDGIAHVWRWVPDASDWVPSDDGIGLKAVVSLLPSGDGHLIAVNAQGELFRSGEGNTTWERVGDAIPPGSLAHHQGPGGLFLGGSDLFLRPFMLRSGDSGRRWEPMVLDGRFGESPDARIVSIGTSNAGQHTLVVVADDRVYVSHDAGGSFQFALRLGRTSGYALVNPTDSDEILVASDLLYHSRDGGLTWVGYAPPKGGELGKMVADWERRYVALWDWQPWPQPLTLYCANLDAPDRGEVRVIPPPR